MRVHISSKDVGELPKMMLDQTGSISFKFVVKGANIYDDETMSEDTISYDLDCEMVNMKVNKTSLQDSLKHATESYSDDENAIMVKNIVQPSP
jgi:carbamoylphosphate synthase large subunit